MLVVLAMLVAVALLLFATVVDLQCLRFDSAKKNLLLWKA